MICRGHACIDPRKLFSAGLTLGPSQVEGTRPDKNETQLYATGPCLFGEYSFGLSGIPIGNPFTAMEAVSRG